MKAPNEDDWIVTEETDSEGKPIQVWTPKPGTYAEQWLADIMQRADAVDPEDRIPYKRRTPRKD